MCVSLCSRFVGGWVFKILISTLITSGLFLFCLVSSRSVVVAVVTIVVVVVAVVVAVVDLAYILRFRYLSSSIDNTITYPYLVRFYLTRNFLLFRVPWNSVIWAL